MPVQKYEFYGKDVAAGPWMQAYRKMMALLYDDEGGRFEPSKHGEIDKRLFELYTIMNRPGDQDKERTRFGDKKLPVAKGSHGTYSKMQKGENLAGLWQAFGCHLDDFEARALALPTYGMDRRPFIELHKFNLAWFKEDEHEDADNWAQADAIKAYFHTHVEENETVTAISVRLLGAGQASIAGEPSGKNTERSLMATKMFTLRDMICELEQKRLAFSERCAEAVPLLESALEAFKTDAERDEGEDGDSDAEGSPNPKRVKKEPTTDAAETLQRVDLFFNKLRPPRGTEDGRKNAFKGEAGPHVAELLYAMLHRGDDARLPRIVAPSVNEGADIRWSFTAQAYEFVPPSENPDASTVVTAKIQSLPDEERDAITKAYLDVQTMAKELNVASRELVSFIQDTFSLRFFLHKTKSVSLADAQAKDEALCELPPAVSFTQELVLFQVYMHAIFTPKEVEAEEEEEEQDEGESSSGDDSADEDYDENASSRDEEEEDDSDDDSDDDASADEDDEDASGASGSDSDSD